MRSTSTPASGAALDGGDPRWNRGGQRSGVRSKIHTAVVVLGRGSSREAYGPGPAQHVQGGRALDHYWRRQLGRDQDIRRCPLPTPPIDRGKEILALRGERRASSPLGIEPPRARLEAVRIVDMSPSNAWAEDAM